MVPPKRDADPNSALAITLARAALADAGYVQATLNSARIGLVLDPGSPSPLNDGNDSSVGSRTDGHVIAESLGIPRTQVRVESFSAPLASIAPAVSQLRQGIVDTLLVGDLYLCNDGNTEPELPVSGGMLVLRRVDDARRDGNFIYAVLKAVCVFADADQSQAANDLSFISALRQAYEGCGISPRTVALIEAITNDSPDNLSDEVQSLAAVFGAPTGILPWCALGNGPDQSDITVLIKTALALHNAVVPPASCGANGFRLDDEKTPFYLSDTPRPWIHGDRANPRRAAVHQSGSGGRTHLVLEACSHPQSVSTRSHAASWPTELLCFSDKGRADLLSLLKQSLTSLSTHPDTTLEQLAFSCSQRPVKTHRLAIIARDVADLKHKLELATAKLEREPERASWQLRDGVFFGESDERAALGRIAFTFPGYGSYYQGMLSDLCMAFPLVRDWFDTLDGIFDEARGPRPSQLLYPPPKTFSAATQKILVRNLHGMRGGAQAGLVASLAMHELLVQLGVRCDVMVGHSNGENAALMASGAMRFRTKAELFKLIRRFTVQDDQSVATAHQPRGVFLSVSGLTSEFIEQLVTESNGDLHLAMDNCPHQVVLFGGEADSTKIAARITQAGGIAVRLPFDRAYHTRLYKAQEKTIRAIYSFIDFIVPRTPVYSCVTASQFPNSADEVRALAIEQWSSCVRFRETIETLYRDGVRTFVEVGPNSTLTAFTRDTFRDRDHLAVICDTPHVGGLTQLQHLLAQLFVRGENLNLDYLFKFREIEGRASIGTVDRDAPPTIDALPKASVAPASLVSDATHTKSVVPADDLVPLGAFTNTPLGVTCTSDELRVPPSSTHASGLSVHAQIMRGHSQLMQQFLESQERLLGAFLKVRPTPRVGVEDRHATTAGVSTAKWPLLGRPVEVSDKRIYSERIFSIETDAFLKDHAMGRQPADAASGVSPLPVIPFTVSMEIVAEAASELVGADTVVLGISNARGHRWLAAERGTLRLGASAELQPAGPDSRQNVYVQLVDLDTAEGEAPQLAFEATVHVARSYAPRPTPLAPAAGESAISSLSPAEFYRDFLFHGPFFQSVKSLRSCGDVVADAELEVPSSRGFASGIRAPVFRTPAALLDAAGQVIALWHIARGRRNFNVFPFYAANFEQYAAPPAAGSQALCRAIVSQNNGIIVEASFDFLDEHGLVFARFKGFQFRNYTDEYVSRLLRPQTAETFFSKPFMQKETGLICRTIEPETADVLEAGGGVWKQVLAHLVLNPDELGRWQKLPRKGRRRLEWLIGRVTAKDVVRQWATQTIGLALSHSEIEILTDEAGRPFVKCTKLDALGLVPHISISHTHGQAVSVADASRVGIDIERLDTRRSSNWANAALDTEELAVAGGDTSTLLQFWCAKEAAAKARGTGLRGDPRAWRVTNYSTHSRRVTVAYGDAVGEVALWSEGNSVLAVCRLDQR
ncbi:MAG: hypothetical protein QOE96_3113 [Blastocatellia bacterium]|nr:hypothetical protein [Blastocatellia bacterium]